MPSRPPLGLAENHLIRAWGRVTAIAGLWLQGIFPTRARPSEAWRTLAVLRQSPLMPYYDHPRQKFSPMDAETSPALRWALGTFVSRAP